MASTILNKLKNKAAGFAGQSNGGDLLSQFMSFKKDFESKGEDPQTVLNNLLASGKVPPGMYNKAKALATVFANKFKSGR